MSLRIGIAARNDIENTPKLFTTCSVTLPLYNSLKNVLSEDFLNISGIRLDKIRTGNGLEYHKNLGGVCFFIQIASKVKSTSCKGK